MSPQARPKPFNGETPDPRRTFEPDPLMAQAQADALNRIATAMEVGIARFGPAADAVAALGEAQHKFCNFIVGHRLKLAMAIPGLLLAVGAIQPSAAKGLADLLRTFVGG